MPTKLTKANESDWRDSPTAWFAALERARLTNNFQAAAMANRELLRLGVRVQFSRAARPSKTNGGGSWLTNAPC
jgi:hypothetical protein